MVNRLTPSSSAAGWRRGRRGRGGRARMKVLILERGRRWSANECPRKPGDPWLFNDRDPARQTAGSTCDCFRRWPWPGAGVGGGSLAYSNVAEAPRSSDGLARKSYRELKLLRQGAQVMRLQVLPDGQLTKRFNWRERSGEDRHAPVLEGAARRLVLRSGTMAWTIRSPRHSRPASTRKDTQARVCISGIATSAVTSGEEHARPTTFRSRSSTVRRSSAPWCAEEPQTGGYVIFDRIENGRLVAARSRAASGGGGRQPRIHRLLLRCRDEAKRSAAERQT
jgi:hypothetical protein